MNSRNRCSAIEGPLCIDGTIGIFAIQKDGTLKSAGSAGGITPNSGFNGIAAS